MNNFLKKIRSAIWFMTVASIGLNAFSPSHVMAATVEEGQYIKGEKFSDVYFVGRDSHGNLVREPFMNEQIFFTWQNNFNNVVTVTDDVLSSLSLGPLVLPKTGVVLVKIQSVNKVYAVEGDQLRWIPSEAVAKSLYGNAWADYVIDLPPTIWPHFVLGQDMNDDGEAVDTSIMKTRSELVATDEGDNPFTGASFYVDPNSSARKQVTSWAQSRPSDAAALEKLASQPTARWFGDWDNDIRSAVDSYVTKVTAANALPVLVAYNIPNRDCGSYSAGGVSSNSAYRTWITNFAAGIGSRAAVVVLEPDATATSCVTDERLAVMGDAVAIFKAQARTSVYIDAGHDNWIPAATMAKRLLAANVEGADGFALNVSNFYTDAQNTTYGTAVSKLIGNKHFIMDTSRNGNGWNGEWCNPTGRHIGVNPTTNTGNVLVDALLWIKIPGQSDGTCNGGPSAGAWWAEYALGLVK